MIQVVLCVVGVLIVAAIADSDQQEENQKQMARDKIRSGVDKLHRNRDSFPPEGQEIIERMKKRC